MLFEGLILTAIVGRLAGGRFHRLGDVGLRWPWLFVAALALRAIPPALARGGWAGARDSVPGFEIAAYALLIIALLFNLRWREMWIAALGVGLNFAVIAANGGRMPADLGLVRAIGDKNVAAAVEQGRWPTHTAVDSHTRLPFLADVHALPRPYPRPHVFSIGDVLITIGVCLFLLRAMGAFGLRAPPAPEVQS
jgi:hypothetical protein